MERKPMTREESKAVSIGILKAFHQFCVKNDLKYYLCNGTLLGAIRHKGFIPWDDDIDVMMPRPDYMKFLELVKAGNTIGPYYDVDSPYIDSGSIGTIMSRIFDTRTELTFTNVRFPVDLGCWIDVFPLDGRPASPALRKLQVLEYRVVSDLYICWLTKMGGERRSKIVTVMQYALLPLLPFIRMIGGKRYRAWLWRIVERYGYEESDYVGAMQGFAEERETIVKSHMEPAVLVEFGGGYFYTMANYDEYLTNLYGDYMTPPPEGERRTRHFFEVYKKDGI